MWYKNMMCIITMCLSLFTLGMTIAITFAEEESAVFMFFDEQKSLMLTIISIVLLVIELIVEKINDYKTRRNGNIL